MKTRHGMLLIALALVLALGSCRASATPAPSEPPAAVPPAPGNEPAPARITIQRVQIDGNTGEITVSGHSALPDGEDCLQVRLLQEGQPLAWWPAERCAEMSDGAWELTVPLPEGALQPDVDYELRAAVRGGAEAVFWFDLSGPRNPER